MRKGEQRVLGHRVADRDGAVADALGIGRGDVDDAAVSALAQVRQAEADEPERRLRVGLPERVEILLRPFLEIDHAEDAGVVDERVNAAPARQCRRDPGLGRRRDERIEAMAQRARCIEPGRRFLQRRHVPCTEGNTVAVGMQPPRHGESDAAVGAGDERDAPLAQNTPWYVPPSCTMFCAVMKPACALQR